MPKKYYQKNKESLQKEVPKRLQILFEEEKKQKIFS